MRSVFLSALLLLAIPDFLSSAPISVQEISFLLRQRSSEKEILREVQQRKLLTSIDDKAMAELKKNGATDSLIHALRAPGMALSLDEQKAEIARIEMRKAQAQKFAAESEAAALEKQKLKQSQSSVTVHDMLEGRLIKLDHGIFRDADGFDIQEIEVFAFYYATMTYAPCRAFTPKLVSAYKEMKKLYPELEIIFVSADKDDFNMRYFMREYKMPWFSVRFDEIKTDVKQWAGVGVPWLVAVNKNGQPLTKNGVSKQYIPAEEALEAIQKIMQEKYPQR